jgi:putative ABC transport system permease protein
MHSFLQDIRYGLRMLAKAPGITLAAIFAFGLGIGANTATFSTANTFLLHPISFPEVDRLAMVMARAPGQTEGWSEVSPADFQEWREQNHSFEALAAYEWDDVNLTGVSEPVKVQGFLVSANFFDVLRAKPVLGRTFVTGEDEPGRHQEVILSNALWRRQFGSDPAVIGRSIHLDGKPTQVIGVMADEVRFPISAELWMPLALSPQEKTSRSVRYLNPIGRLRPGVTRAQAQAELNTIQDRLRGSFPDTETGWGVQAMGLGEFISGPGRGYNLMSLIAVGFVLLIACSNVANLLLARSSARQNEFAIRVALGASRGRLIRQVVIESVLLATGGTVVGLLLGSWWISLIRLNMPPEVARFIPGWNNVRLDREVFLYTLAVALIAGILAGIVPAFQSTRNFNQSLKEAGRGGGASRSRTRFRSAFIVLEVALSLVLLVGAGLMVKGVETLLHLNFKFDPQSVLTFRVALPHSRYETPQQRAAFFDSLMERLNHSPGVQSSAVAIEVPFAGGNSSSFSIQDQPVQPGEFHEAEYNDIGSSYFQLLHVPLAQGRAFDERDSADAPPVAIVSENLAKRYWPGRSAIGHRIKPGSEDSKERWATIVGVVAEINYNPWRHDPPPAIYFPFRQRPASNVYMAVRTSGDPKALLPVVRSAVSSIDPDQPIFDVYPLDHVISNSIIGFTYVAVMMGVFGFMALVLSAVGVSGVMAYAVSQRIHEIGVRMAIGARPRDVLSLFIFNGLKLLLLGVVIGLPLAFGLARLLSSLLFGVQSNDFTSFFGGALLLAVVVFFACYIPARAATRVDPIIALRYE